MPAWSLSVEMQLYLTAPFIVYSIHRFKSKALFTWLLIALCCTGYYVTIPVNHNFNFWYAHFSLLSIYKYIY